MSSCARRIGLTVPGMVFFCAQLLRATRWWKKTKADMNDVAQRG